jgi:hypothetical protein
MAAIDNSTRRLSALRSADGYVVESPHGDVGEVEEVWLDHDDPCALAVRFKDGRRALLLSRDVVAVDRERRWVVVPEEAQLLELDAPRLKAGEAPTASWSTTGNVVAIAPRDDRNVAAARRAEPSGTAERPLWEMIAILYVGLLVIVAFVTALAFTVALLA